MTGKLKPLKSGPNIRLLMIIFPFLREYNGGYLTGVRSGFYNSDDETVVRVSKFQYISSDPEKCVNDFFRNNFSFSDVIG
ncbi:hypothetical protein ACL7TT_05190 [Microbulbifer sp. 2304DJ12-6]|uniref:hypothetical protein n=1 Tax=Microbulbifer sp. 2304DJ12-6 TaxID=3233340 RepID=UPI0039B0CE40